MVADKWACPVESPSCGWLVGWVAFDPMQVNLGLQSVHLIRLLDALQMDFIDPENTPFRTTDPTARSPLSMESVWSCLSKFIIMAHRLISIALGILIPGSL